MTGHRSPISSLLGSFQMLPVSMRYSLFVPRLYNLAKSLGFEQGKIMPSRAFCSDESQGYPIILIAKHFGSFPFNHGLVGGVVATDRHGPYAHHGQDLVMIQASHVGYDPKSGAFGVYRRLQTEHQEETTSCGKICGALDRYLDDYAFAKSNILLRKGETGPEIVIDNQLHNADRNQGLILKMEDIVEMDSTGNPIVRHSLSTSKTFLPSSALLDHLKAYEWKAGKGEPIGEHLLPDMFFFRRQTAMQQEEGRDHLENNLIDVMPHIVTSDSPALTAAQANTQVEFDRAFRTIVQHDAYRGKNVMFVSGLNVDISPGKDQRFPLTKFIPWAAYVKDTHDNHWTWEQTELFEKLNAQSPANPDKVDLESAIQAMENAEEILLPF
ncbi:MAG: hypothetical protein V3V12_10020 [Gammaproteobacteria bacterium]